MDCSSVTCSAGVNFDCLEFITVEEIKDAIPPIGIRVLFREKLFAWRKTKFTLRSHRLQSHRHKRHRQHFYLRCHLMRLNSNTLLTRFDVISETPVVN
ncbi:uncharacterized protein LOC121467347 isoform X2 [Drosophila elegans]|uniref:uncharacterized protein LOC121467347 isoform X2 n=1 Tax=Drosophila elegans TaxID=30023 RepID=UPI001BC8524D|nr:uncharacterized protein LOC121467347 isoform X2 [Drosophila elegans]